MNDDKITPEILYQFLVLSALVKLGGSAERNRVLSYIKSRFGNHLSKKDLEDYKSGHGERWKNHISFARQHLVEKEYLRRASHGIWEITESGRKQYEKWVDEVKQTLSQAEQSK